MGQNGLNGRVERLEMLVQDVEQAHNIGGELLMRKLADLAVRLHGTPEKLIGHQAPAERTVRAGLAAAEGHTGAEYARRFWRAVADYLRELRRGRAA